MQKNQTGNSNGRMRQMLTMCTAVVLMVCVTAISIYFAFGPPARADGGGTTPTHLNRSQAINIEGA